MKLRINDKSFDFFDSVAITKTLDSVASVFSFVARFNPENQEHRALFKPLSYPKVEILDNEGRLQLTGVITNHAFVSQDTPQLAKLSGYSLAGILENANIPYKNYPLESNNKTLIEITERLVSLFGLKLIVDSSVQKDAGLQYAKSVAGPTESIKQYIAKLAAQRNIVLSHDVSGNVVLFRPNVKASAKYKFSKNNVKQMSLTVNGQDMHSEISVLKQPGTENKNLAPVDTILNPIVAQYRPLVRTLSSGTDTDTSKAADNALASELENITLSMDLEGVLDINLGDVVEVENNEVFIFKPTKFIVSSITINESSENSSMALTLTLPQAYTGESPENIFE